MPKTKAMSRISSILAFALSTMSLAASNGSSTPFEINTLNTQITSATSEPFIINSQSIDKAKDVFFDTRDDLDADGIPDVWEINVWGNITEASAETDNDDDGLVNLMEFSQGLPPDAKSQIESTVTSSTAQGYLQFSFVRRTNDPALEYIVELSSNLSDWDTGAAYLSTISTQPIDATYERVTMRPLDSLSQSSPQFIRLRVETAP